MPGSGKNLRFLRLTGEFGLAYIWVVMEERPESGHGSPQLLRRPWKVCEQGWRIQCRTSLTLSHRSSCFRQELYETDLAGAYRMIRS